MKTLPIAKISFTIALSAIIGGEVCAGEPVELITAQFARDLYASRASILIIGDSTNNPRGAGNFVPYYEGFIQTFPSEIELCGFRVSGSTGNTGVNIYVRFGGGSTSQMVDGGIDAQVEDVAVGVTPHAPPGFRNEFTIIEGGVLSSTGRFASIGLVNLQGIFPNADQWALNSTVVIRTPFYISSDGSTLTSFSTTSLTDHDGSAGNSPFLFDQGKQVDVQLDNDRYGLQSIDTVFVNPSTARLGVLFSGDLDTNDGEESGKTLAWCDHILFNQSLANQDRGVYFDSVSLGGYTAKDHAEGLDPEIFDDYFMAAPRDYSTVLIWLGQNAELDEWTGIIQPVWIERIEAIGDLAIQAAIDAGSKRVPVPVLITPPLADDDYPGVRFTAMDEALDEIANRRGWGHIDLHTLVGNSLTNIDPAFDGPGPHPSQEGAIYLTSLFYEHLDCLRAEFTGDKTRNFFDVSRFLELYMLGDLDADLTGDGANNFFDISAFLDAFTADCP
jgi:hypothetical protein